MSIDLSTLSAKELFEMARKKEQEELEEQGGQGHHTKINDFINQRKILISAHKNVLLLTNKKIRDMQAQREKLIADHESRVAEIDNEIKLLGGEAPQTGETIEFDFIMESDDDSKLKSTIRQVMNKRDYISSSMLKEKLAAYGVKPVNFNQALELWLRNGWFESKGKGSYTLGKNI